MRRTCRDCHFLVSIPAARSMDPDDFNEKAHGVARSFSRPWLPNERENGTVDSHKLTPNIAECWNRHWTTWPMDTSGNHARFHCKKQRWTCSDYSRFSLSWAIEPIRDFANMKRREKSKRRFVITAVLGIATVVLSGIAALGGGSFLGGNQRPSSVETIVILEWSLDGDYQDYQLLGQRKSDPGFLAFLEWTTNKPPPVFDGAPPAFRIEPHGVTQDLK